MIFVTRPLRFWTWLFAVEQDLNMEGKVMMPIVIRNASMGQVVFSGDFSHEKDLESLLADLPSLLRDDDARDFGWFDVRDWFSHARSSPVRFD
jgi:hypothetical protein